MDNWLFYYDESFHDRKITCKSGKINIYQKGSSDIFVGAFVGFKDKDTERIKNNFLEFEQNQKIVYGLSNEQEFKGSTIRKKNFKYGISTFNSNCHSFYSEYFKLFDESMLIHISMLSKTALFIEHIFENVSFPANINRNKIIYSIVKFIYTYRCYDLLAKLFKTNDSVSTEDVINRLRKYMIVVVENGEKAKRKAREVGALKDIILLMDNLEFDIQTSIEYNWDYNEIFQGFQFLLDEKNINNQIELIIDNEERTYNAATNVLKDASLSQNDSMSTYGIRISDVLANFIGRMIESLDTSLGEKKISHIKDLETYDFKTRKLLSPNWFKLSQKNFDLYKLIYKILMIDNGNFWTVYGDIFVDYTMLFTSLIKYICTYDSFSEYLQVTILEHSEQFNTFSLEALEYKFNQF